MLSALSVVESNEPEIVADFESFWAVYPRKVAKKAARTAWERIGPKYHVSVVTAAAAWAKVWRDKEPNFIPHAATWLHGERWEDELPVEYKATNKAHIAFVGKPEEFKRAELSPQVQDAIRKALGR